MFVVIGADWCNGCRGIRKKLTQMNLEHRYIRIPPGKDGWDFVEQMTGKRSLPAVFLKFDKLTDFYRELEILDLPERELTEEELDEFDD